jgi:hypothetical protein
MLQRSQVQKEHHQQVNTQLIEDPQATGVLFGNLYAITPEIFVQVMSVYQRYIVNAPRYFVGIISFKPASGIIVFAGYCNSTYQNCLDVYNQFNSSMPTYLPGSFIQPTPFYDAWKTLISGCNPIADQCNETVCFNNYTKMYYCTGNFYFVKKYRS